MLNRAPAIRRFPFVGLAIGLVVMLASACVSDYRGYLGHKTDAESKLWGQEGSILADPDPEGFSGTYAPTVKYDFRGYRSEPTPGTCPDTPDPSAPAGCTYPDGIVIMVYRNPTVGAFSRDGCVDRDGDDVQQRQGINPATPSCDLTQPSITKFEPKFRFIDRNVGCQFFANYDQTFGSPKVVPTLVVCYNAPQEEIDKDLTLQGSPSSNVKEAFSSLDDLYNKIWSGAIAYRFSAEVAAVTVNGTRVDLPNPMGIALARNNMRVINYTLDLTTPGGKDFIRALLANTESGRSARLTLEFTGGLTIRTPSTMVMAFNHDALKKML